MKTIHLLRHGEPLGGSLYRGNRIDDPLSEKGWQQMTAGIGQATWDIIFSSPLIRCAAFARKTAKNQQIEMQIIDNLKEIGFGDWEGKTKTALRLERAEEFAAFYQNPIKNTPSNAEPVLEFFTRIGEVWQQLLKQPEEQILVVAHAGVIRAMICHAIDAPVEMMYRLNIQNGRLSQIDIQNKIPLLTTMNIIMP